MYGRHMGILAILKDIAGRSLESVDQVQVAEELAIDQEEIHLLRSKSEIELRQIAMVKAIFGKDSKVVK